MNKKYDGCSAAFIAARSWDVVPERFRDDMDDVTQITDKHVIDYICDFEGTMNTYGKGFGLYIHGDSGVGKTATAYCMFHYLRSQGYKPAFVRSYEISNAIKACSGPMPFQVARGEAFDSNDMTEPINRWIEADKFIEDLKFFRGILFIDDIGAEKLDENILEKYYEIIDTRYGNNCPTIYTSNFSLTELGDVFYKRICSRINRTCGLVELKNA